jgi:hypothetical protein
MCAKRNLALSGESPLHVPNSFESFDRSRQNMEPNVDLLKSDSQRLQEDTAQEQEELEHVVIHHAHDGEHINNAC